MKPIFLRIFKSLALFCLRWLYNFIDDDKDGKVTKKELLKAYEKINQKI